MGLDVGGNLITQAGSVLTVNTGVSMTMNSAGGVLRPNQIQFQAVGNPGGTWTNFTQGAWNVIPFSTVITNVNSCYNPATSRFTAPVNGEYFFQACCGHLLKDGASDSYYWHPVFAVNGALGGRAVNTAYPYYRIRGYGCPIAAYFDSHITQVYDLLAGDYVEHQVYSNGSPTNRYYTPYTRFTGFLLG
jgi:C1q domain